MWARVSTFRGSPDKVDEGDAYARENIVPRLRETDGFRGLYSLTDRTSGDTVAITLWASEAALLASEEDANQMRDDGATRAQADIAKVERFEVTIAETV